MNWKRIRRAVAALGIVAAIILGALAYLRLLVWIASTFRIDEQALCACGFIGLFAAIYVAGVIVRERRQKRARGDKGGK